MIQNITSRKNSAVKRIRSLQMGKYRRELGEFVIEGIKPVCDAAAAGAEIVCAAAAYQQAELAERLFGDQEIPIYTMPDEVFASLSETEAAQGILVCVRIPQEEWKPAERGFYLYCDGISDPGNAGTIIRIADAVRADGVLFSPDSVDVFSGKTVRSAAGSFFHVKVYPKMERDRLLELKNMHYTIAGGILDSDSVGYLHADLTPPVALVIGNEANGISPPVREICTQKVIIPILGQAESLNAAVAAALLCYEVRRREGKLE